MQQPSPFDDRGPSVGVRRQREYARKIKELQAECRRFLRASQQPTDDSDDRGPSVPVKRQREREREIVVVIAEPFYLQYYLKSTKYSPYEKVEKLLAEYVSNPWYTLDTSKLKLYLQAISADGRFELLKKKQYEWSHYTALHKAAERGDTEVMRCLLKMVEPQKRYELLKIQGWWSGGKTALHAAASRGRTEVMRCMLQLVEPEKQIQLLDIPDEYKNTAVNVFEVEETVQLIRQYREIAGTPGRRKSGDEPFEEHARWFPDCSYLLQLKGEKYRDEVHVRSENNKTTTSSVPDNPKWIFNPSLHGISSAVPSPPSYLTDILCYVVGGPPDTPNLPSLDLLQQLEAMSPQEYRAAIRNELPPFQLYWLMSMEMQRRKTFLDDWPHVGNLSGEKMAQAGFYHSGDNDDSVRCVFCGVVIHSWDVNDNPMNEHIKWFPHCRFVQGLACGNMECPTGHPSDGVLSAPVQKGADVNVADAANSI